MADELTRILIVDDEPNMLHMLSTILQQDGFEPVCARTAAEALTLVAQQEFDFILSDVRMPGMDGIQLLERLKESGVDVIVILMSAYGNVELALEAIRKGAYDYISKPFKTDEVVLTLRKASEREKLRREVVRLRRRLRHSEPSPEIVARSPAIRTLLEMVHQVGPVDCSVLITGDSGTGKELLAREIHRCSSRSEGPFVPVNCAAIPAGLLESELFGHAAGAFTGARVDKPGLFEEADGGTLLLDEIGAMEPALQAKLLRAIESGEIRRIGDTTARRVRTRIVAATNEHLDDAIKSGRFREDLYYRLNVVHLHVPPLAQRREDIIPLVEHFVEIFNRKMGLRVRAISREAQEALLKYSWKGNVRELQNVVERAMIFTSGDTIALDSLPHDIRAAVTSPAAKRAPREEILSIKRASRELERALITKALNRTGGNRSQAAGLLEISYPSLLQKIKEYGIV
ncbi:MAG: sigma-54 dependent transcriptional regulator [Desulfomonile sp.]|nr:sigma-54 dependent transcriptional regulator [Desulfomonile sp.]